MKENLTLMGILSQEDRTNKPQKEIYAIQAKLFPKEYEDVYANLLFTLNEYLKSLEECIIASHNNSTKYAKNYNKATKYYRELIDLMAKFKRFTSKSNLDTFSYSSNEHNRVISIVRKHIKINYYDEIDELVISNDINSLLRQYLHLKIAVFKRTLELVTTALEKKPDDYLLEEQLPEHDNLEMIVLMNTIIHFPSIIRDAINYTFDKNIEYDIKCEGIVKCTHTMYYYECFINHILGFTKSEEEVLALDALPPSSSKDYIESLEMLIISPPTIIDQNYNLSLTKCITDLKVLIENYDINKQTKTKRKE